MPEPDQQEQGPPDDSELDDKFADLAVDQGLITRPQVEEAVKAQKTIIGLGLKRSLSEILIEKGLITQAQSEAVSRSIEAGADVKFVAGYELLGKLGEGGMGVVYKAQQISLDRTVALKILPERLGRDREFVARFTREARMAARLDHVNIVRALDVGEAQGVHYFAMEFVEGEDVGSIIDREGKMSEDRAISIIMQSARALGHAHEHQLIHRDIKPDNILLTPQGIAKVADLGLARSTDEHTTRMTVTGTAMGTPHYISPEQARGEREIDIRTDIYSLGVTFFHMLAGEPPFHGSSAAIVITRRLTEDAPWIRDGAPEVFEGTALVIRRMMQRERDNRYSTPAELIHDLELVADGKMPEVAGAAPGTVMWGSKDVKPGKTAAAAVSAPTAAPERKKLPPLAWAAVAGGGVVALLLVVLIVALASGPADKPPDGGGKPPDGGEVTTNVGALVKKTLVEIDELAKAGQFEQAIQACEDAKSSYDGTPHAQVFATRLGALKLDQARAEREAAAKERLDAIVADREAGKLERALERARAAKDKYARTSLAEDFRRQVTELETALRAARLVQNRLVKIETLEEAGALDRALELANEAVAEFEASGQTGPLVEAAKRIGAKIAKRDAAKLAGAAERELKALTALAAQGKLDEALDRARAAAGKYAATPSGKAIAGLVESLTKRVAERDRKIETEARAKVLLARAAVFMRQERYADAAAAYAEAGKIQPSGEASKGAAEARFRMHMRLSTEKERAGDLGGAIEETKKALAVKPDASASKRLSTLERRLKVVGMVAEAQRLEAGGKLPGALGAYRQALGIALSDQKPAIEAAIKRIGLSIEYAEAMRSARGYVSAKRWTEARAAAARALRSKPGDAKALALLDTIRKAVEAARVKPPTVPDRPEPPKIVEAPRETRKTSKSVGIRFVLVPAAEYAIGDERGQPDERPVRKVKLDAYYIGLTEITNAQYEKFDSRHRRKRSEFSPGDDHPVVNVSWSDAEKFCKWLSKKEKTQCRLPTEAEWEAAARGNEGRRFPWGSEAPDSGGVFRANWGEGEDRAGWARDGYRNAAPVGKFPAGASPFGCLDMAGNVWEWCGDRYSDDYYAKGDLENPTGARKGSDRVLRGGAFNNDIEYARSANRHKTSYKRADPTIGFRVVMEIKRGK